MVKYGRSDGSLTVEAAMALPLFLLLMGVFLFWMRFYETQAESMEKLNDRLRSAAKYAYLADTALDVGPEDMRIVLMDFSELSVPLPFIGGKTVFGRQAYARPFIGRHYHEGKTEVEQEQDSVYVTETGTVYHTERSCTHLKLSIRAVSYNSLEERRNQNGAKYYSCERCGKNEEMPEDGMIYITSEGNRYHYNLSCSGLTRRIRSITREEAESEGKRPCSRCGAKSS